MRARRQRPTSMVLRGALLVGMMACWALALTGGIAQASPKAPQESKQPQPSATQSETQGQGDGAGDGGDAPTLQVAQASLRIGQPMPVPISIIGVNSNEDPQVEAIVTIAGGIGEVRGVRGSTLTFTTPLSDLVQILQGLVVTAEGSEVTISVRAYPTGKPEAAVSASRTLTASGPQSSATPVPTSKQPAPSQEPSSEPPPPTPRPTMTSRTIALPAYDPLSEPEETVSAAVAAAAIIGAVGLTAGSVAATVTGTPGSAHQTSPTVTSDARTSGRREEQAASPLAPGDSGSFLAIDANLEGMAAAMGAASLRRRASTWKLPFTEAMDRAVAALFAAVARLSPLGARMVGDSTYLRAMLGSASTLLPLAGVVLGILGVLDVGGLALAPTVALLGAVIFLGTLDALAGFLAVAAFTIGIAASGGLTDASSVRTMMGLAIIGFGPALIAGASRPMRRPGDDYSAWERIGDFVVIPLIGAFAVQGTVSALPALSGYAMPIAAQADLLAVIAIAGLLMRVTLEELAARACPERIAAVAPPDIAPHGVIRRLILIAVRTFLFGFAAVAFIGNVWQLWVGLAIFAAAELCVLLAPRMPNSPAAYHVLPVGVPRFVFIVLVASGLGTLATLLAGTGADLARTSFVLLLLPGLALAALGMFGKAPREGDVRWYLRPSLRVVYRIGGVLMVISAVWLTQFAPVG